VEVDSRELRKRFDLPDFCGQLFLQVTGAAGHDVFKYALDVDGVEDGATLSCTHDANAWPAVRYAGLPTPRSGEVVTLWLQNSHGTTIPPGGLRLTGPAGEARWELDAPLGPWATRELRLGADGSEGASQWVLDAGRHLVRPRYGIEAAGHERIAHLNVYRDDLAPDPACPLKRLGKGYLLPAPILDPERYASEVLVTPMSAAQNALGLRALLHDAEGRAVRTLSFARAGRGDHRWHDLSTVTGHVELCHDADDPGDIDGWFHAIFRYTDRRTGHAAETSFGCHLFNGVMTYRREPQSYAGPPPGLSTRLFLRLAPAQSGARTHCHLIYPTSTTWRAHSATQLLLHDRNGALIAEESLVIPRSGSRHFVAEKLFADALPEAGDRPWILIRDTTCRLFGYHGLERAEGFSLDHLFGF